MIGYVFREVIGYVLMVTRVSHDGGPPSLSGMVNGV